MVFGELGALGLVLRRVALEVRKRVERRRREPGEEGQRADGESRQRRRDGSDRRQTLKSPANGSFMNPRSTMLQMNKFRAVAYIYRRVLVAQG